MNKSVAMVIAGTAFALAVSGLGPAAIARAFETGFSNNAVELGQVSPSTSAVIQERVGADIDRVAINWSGLEPTPGVFRFGAWDQIYREDLSRGIRPLFVFVSSPTWARGTACNGVAGTCHAPPTPAHYRYAARAVAAIAERYPQAAGIEVWNEPNTPYFWRPRPNPEAYTALLATIHGAVKEVDPSMKVVAPATAGGPGSTYTGKIAGADFLGAVYLAGGGEYIDAISFHAYVNQMQPSVDSVLSEVARVRWVRDVLGDPATPLWVTETGVSTTGPYPVDMMKQASIVLDIDTELRLEPGVETLLFHTMIEPPVSASSPQRGFGLMTAGFWPKPAICVVARVWGAPPLC